MSPVVMTATVAAVVGDLDMMTDEAGRVTVNPSPLRCAGTTGATTSVLPACTKEMIVLLDLTTTVTEEAALLWTIGVEEALIMAEEKEITTIDPDAMPVQEVATMSLDAIEALLSLSLPLFPFLSFFPYISSSSGLGTTKNDTIKVRI